MENFIKNKNSIVSFLFVVIVVAVVIYLLQNKQTLEQDSIKDTTIGETVNQVTVNVEEKVETKQISKNNMEEKISKTGDVLTMNYTGRLENGTVFDSNVDPKFGHVTPFKFTLGAGQVIAGWDEGLVGMKIGDKKILVIPPEKGYGSVAIGNVIPANATLIFEVELVGIE